MSGNGKGHPPEPPPIIGESPAIRRAIQLIEGYAGTNLTILLVGATGTGKDLFAEHVHWRTGRPGRMVAVNCAAMPRDTAESLLFGHRRGAFTGAVESRPGYFQLAHGRTLFLDEVLSLPLECQAKLLRAVETGEVWPLGESEPVQVDVRMVAAVQDDVTLRLEAGDLRRDLYRRLAGIVVSLPPLARRPEDVFPIARHFAALYGRALGAGARRVLAGYGWPENVRELRQAVERATWLVPDRVILGVTLAEAIALGAPARAPAREPASPSTSATAADAERAHLLEACRANGWNPERTARALGVSRATLFRRLRKHGLSLRRPPCRTGGGVS